MCPRPRQRLATSGAETASSIASKTDMQKLAGFHESDSRTSFSLFTANSCLCLYALINFPLHISRLQTIIFRMVQSILQQPHSSSEPQTRAGNLISSTAYMAIGSSLIGGIIAGCAIGSLVIGSTGTTVGGLVGAVIGVVSGIMIGRAKSGHHS
jgi:F0F1-type ATP synthase assembly protein I